MFLVAERSGGEGQQRVGALLVAVGGLQHLHLHLELARNYELQVKAMKTAEDNASESTKLLQSS